MNPLFFESLLIKLIISDKKIRERILPYIDIDVFEKIEHKKIIQEIDRFSEKYETFPSVKDLNFFIKDTNVLNSLVDAIGVDESEFKTEFLNSEIEDFFKSKLMRNQAYEIIEAVKNNDIPSLSHLPDKIRETLSFGFDTSIGLDFFNDTQRMYDKLHSTDSYIPSGITHLDRLIKNGFHEKSLTLFLAETNMGKSLIKCGLAVNALLQNKNVLYVSLEMSEDKISERIMANMFDVKLDDLVKLKEDSFIEHINKTAKKTSSNIVIKEYPTRCCNTNKLRNLLKELELKKGFIPDILFVDYLGIMTPNSTQKNNNSNTELKIISEELRGLAVEKAIPIVSALQTNRNGFASASLDLTDVADSIGTTATADVIIGVTQTEELRNEGVYKFIILKNRYGLNKVNCFVGVDYCKMRIEDAPDMGGVKPVNALDDSSESFKNIIADKQQNDKKKGANINW